MKSCAVIAIAKQETLIIIGFTDVLATVKLYFFRAILGILSNLAEWWIVRISILNLSTIL